MYLCLINMYLSPPDPASYGITLPECELPEPNVKAALAVLTSHHHMMDTTKVSSSQALAIRSVLAIALALRLILGFVYTYNYGEILDQVVEGFQDGWVKG